MLVIDNDVCIDCSLCVPQCPIDAIFDIKDLPQDQEYWVEKNASLSLAWPVLTEEKAALPDWEEWDGKEGKRALLIEERCPKCQEET